MTVAMQRETDCGPVAMANHIEAAIGGSAEAAYHRIMNEFGFPEKDGLVADLWDSPTRHFKVLEAITGQKVGLLEGLPGSSGPCVVLLRLGYMAYHWVCVYPGGVWHDGKRITSTVFSDRFPGSRVVMAYAIGATGSLPWYWSVWWWLTKIVAGGVS